ncbi:ATP-dependent DNA ligase [Rhodohalobacter sulfatireducens]|uniref:DNA ligase n=1 Tax=Rhodohalobacter sulfatireducens TaxID=2911366 RepID=A0ABS9KAJ4_9BACT|nr:ATP-dependent DNA ligase [Rhodohalobacter sulfatireducens]MCG2587856.1 ATP-dependent DNA ligase [Rhodohalobacter sulfatireducens]
MNTENFNFYTLCKVIQTIRQTRSTNSKIRIFAEYLRRLKSDHDLHLAAQFTAEGAFEEISGKRASVGSRTSGLAAAKFCEIDYDLVFKPCRTATGSSSETIERLMNNIPEAIEKRDPKNLSLEQVDEIFDRLYTVSSRADKEKILWETWQRMTPVEIKYFIRMLGQGSLRIGFETRSVVSSIAKAFKLDREDVRYAHMITGSIGKTAILAKHNQLEEARFKLFHPLSFMLASPIESRAVNNIEDYIAEEKFDGMRAQVHVHGDEIKIYSRDLNDITRSFPDIISFFRERQLPPTVFDGEICVYKDDTILPFQLLQKRMGIKKPGKKVLDKYPVLFIAYDLLFTNRKPIFDLKLPERRTLLEELAEEYHLPTSVQFEISSDDDIDRLFKRALEHGNEGLMLKHKESNYEYGQRRKSWLKVKKPGGSFDTVIMYAHAGSGKRGGTYSDFTLGISVKDDERYEEEFIPIGKAYGGYTDDELRKINQKVKELTVERYGPTLGLIPELVVEIEFDDIQVNKRTKAGYTMRLPRFKAIRWDLGPSDTNTLRDVENFYQQKIENEPLSQIENPSFSFSTSSDQS